MPWGGSSRWGTSGPSSGLRNTAACALSNKDQGPELPRCPTYQGVRHDVPWHGHILVGFSGMGLHLSGYSMSLISRS